MAVLTTMAPLTGCYSYRPAVERSALTPASAVALRITDAGRVALAPRFGPGVRAIEGQLQSASDSAYQLTVSAVQYIDGRVDKWSGEAVRVPTGTVGVVETRSFSRKRTWLVAALSAATVLLFIASRSLGAFGGVGTQSPSGGGQQQS
jgi:hypothetical protein